MVLARIERGDLAPVERSRVEAAVLSAEVQLLDAQIAAASAGEALLLLIGETPDSEVQLTSAPPQIEDVSYGRVPPAAGNTFDYFTAPTPRFANNSSPGAPGEDVVFLTPARTFQGSINVELSVVSPTAT